MLNELKVFLFNLDSSKTILSLADASETLVLDEREEDALNEVSNAILVGLFIYPKENQLDCT